MCNSFGLTLAGGLLFSGLVSVPAQTIKVMQWNVHGNIGTTTAQAGAGAVAIGRILNYLQPDVLLINEVADGSVATNTSALNQWVGSTLTYLNGGPFYVVVSTESSSIQRNAVVSRYPVLGAITYDDVTTTLRGMHSFQLQLAGTNRLQVFHVHLKCCSDGSSCQEKQDEAQLFSDEMSAWAATNSVPYIFAGDLNEDESNPECVLSSTYHPITMLITNGGLGEFKPTTLSGEYRTWSTSAGTPSIRFDYILAATNRLAPDSGFVFSTMDWAAHGLYTGAGSPNLANDSQTASDHYAVMATYTFAGASTNPPTLQSIQNVFVIMMENQNWSSIKGNASAPYINGTLLPMASHAEQYYNPSGLHPSLPNYLWLEAGTNLNITSDLLPATAHQSTTNHLVTLLGKAGISWRSYQEDICGCFCPLTETNLYVPRHNPFVYFDDVTGTNNSGSAFCIANVRPYSQFAGDLQNSTVARYNFITPNLCNDMHNNTGCATSDPIRNGDTWLATNVPAILNSAAYTNNGVLFILWDEAATGDGPIGLIVLSPLAKGAGYANTLHYTHSSMLRTLEEIFNVGPLLGDAVNAFDLSDLFKFTAGKVSVSPAAVFGAAGNLGGPFTPFAQNYAVSNSGNGTLSWTVTNSASWLTLSNTAGLLAPGSNTVVTASINANANNLPAGNYSATIGFLDASNSANDVIRTATLAVNGTNGSLFGFFDDFSQFPPGNLVGQGNWTQLSTIGAQPLQVTSGGVLIPPGQSGDNQDAYKNFTETSATVYYGLTLSVNNPVTNAAPSYFTALYTSNNAGGFANFRLTARAGDAGQTNFALGIRITGQSGDPYTFGAASLRTGIVYRVIIQATGGGGSMAAYLDPTDRNQGGQAAYANNLIGTGTAPLTLGSAVISQFASGTAPNDGVGIGKLVVSDNFASVYDALANTPVAPVASFSGSPRSGTEPLLVTLNDSSTGLVTNRLWMFGDGSATNTSATAVSHVFSAGSYDVALVVSGPGGLSTNTQAGYLTVWTAFQGWQLQYFGSLTNTAAGPLADPDQDGQNNMTEFLAGTNPTNGASLFHISAIAAEGPDLRITWMTGPGKTNVIERAGAANNGTLSFTDLFTVVTVGTQTNYLDAGILTNASVQYYRIKLVP